MSIRRISHIRSLTIYNKEAEQLKPIELVDKEKYFGKYLYPKQQHELQNAGTYSCQFLFKDIIISIEIMDYLCITKRKVI